MGKFSYSSLPTTIQALIGTLVGNTLRMGFHGKAKITRDGEFYVFEIRVKDIAAIKSTAASADTERSRR